jgi:hypothetical protein
MSSKENLRCLVWRCTARRRSRRVALQRVMDSYKVMISRGVLSYTASSVFSVGRFACSAKESSVYAYMCACVQGCTSTWGCSHFFVRLSLSLDLVFYSPTDRIALLTLSTLADITRVCVLDSLGVVTEVRSFAQSRRSPVSVHPRCCVS